jgi:RNA polymerase sigma factor (TIGR02999 family)
MTAEPRTDRSDSAAAAGGDPTAARSAQELLPLLYAELHELARRRLQGEGAARTLQATALVHEAYLRLVGAGDPRWQGRAHFFAAAAQAMRRVLVDRARDRGRLKRGGGQRVTTLDSAATISSEPDPDVLDLDEALTRLGHASPRKARVVELLHFAGLQLSEVADLLDVSLATVKTDWSYARAWLHRELER